MKKLLYTLAFALIVAASVSSCTEEVVKPKANGTTGVEIRE